MGGMLTMLDIVFDPFGWMLGFGLLAYYAFRMSNQERNDFKLGLIPNAKSIVMKRFNGTTARYLVSGWSALARRPNYWPDLMGSLVYSMCTGFGNPIAWVHFATFFVLLAHRQHRLEEKGRLTYKNWNDFVEAVPYRFNPFLF